MENKYGADLVVIGVHSAKFPTEKVTENIRRAAERYRLRHPIANDSSFKIWNAYGVSAWPTVVLIDTEGLLVGGVSGEGHYALLDRVIGSLLAKAGKKPAERVPEASKPAAPATELRYPGKIAAGGQPVRLFIADTGHDRIVVADTEGRVQAVFGSGEPGFRDGAAAEARFQGPQGVWVDGSTLYVADNENHSIRTIDLEARTVRTLAGTGRQGRWGEEGGKALETSLNSPWDVLRDGSTLAIAMAGRHQIWRLDLSSGEVGPWIGSGREDIADGSAEESALAQPSGLALAGGTLYVADSESSGVRAFDLREKRLRSLVGTGLFDFGDGEGKGGKVLQHPLAVCVDEKDLLIADTYNHRLKRLDLKTGAVRFWLGTGKPGAEDGKSPSFFEPSGLAISGGRLYVADTNNHRIRVVELSSGVTTSLTLKAAEEKPGK